MLNGTRLGTDGSFAGAEIAEMTRLRGKDPPLCVCHEICEQCQGIM